MKNLTTKVKTIRADTKTAAGTGDIVTSDWIDTQGFDGARFLLGMGSITAGATTTFKVSASSSSSGASPVDVAGSAITIADTDDNTIIISDIGHPAKRFVACLVTRGGAQNSDIEFCLVELYNGHRLPAVQDTTVSHQEINVIGSGIA